MLVAAFVDVCVFLAVHVALFLFCFVFILQAKLAFERLPVLKAFHPFVCGPYNQNIKQLIEETGARINVPPASVEKDEIVVSGEKEGVAKCKQVIMGIFEEKVSLHSLWMIFHLRHCDL